MAKRNFSFSAGAVKNIIIVSLLIAFGVCLYLLSPDDSYDGFGLRTKNGTALKHIKDYRDLMPEGKTNIVWYDTSQIRSYLDSFPSLVQNLKGKEGCKWVVGFYFVRKSVGDSPRLNFYVIPTLVNVATNAPLDLYHSDYRQFYAPKNRDFAVEDSGLAANTGHLWP